MTRIYFWLHTIYSSFSETWSRFNPVCWEAKRKQMIESFDLRSKTKHKGRKTDELVLFKIQDFFIQDFFVISVYVHT